MPLDLGHHATWLGPSIGSVAEAGVKDPDMVPRSPNGACQYMRDVLLAHPVGRDTDGVGIAFRFEELVYLRLGKGGIGPEVAAKLSLAIARNGRFQHHPPIRAA